MAFDDSLENDLQDNLLLSKNLIDGIINKVAEGIEATKELSQLKTTAENIRIIDLLLNERLKYQEDKAKILGSTALSRHQAMAEGYRKALTDYLSLIDSVPSAGPISKSAATDLQSLLKAILPKNHHPILGTLPYKHLNYPPHEPSSAPEIVPAYLGGNKTVSAEDTKGSPEAPISQEIALLAQSLNWNPVSIYEYVKNNIDTEWYWGCMKGADDTLHQKSGNDCDQAALLTALLRASGFPTRYVRGTIEFFASDGKPIDRIKNLTGIDDPGRIAEFFQKAGIPFKPVIAGGTISNFQIEHIWVESEIPYSNYRGALIDDHGKAWLGLDTSIKVKGYTYNNVSDILNIAEISERLSGLRDEYLGLSSSGTGSSAFELKQTPLEYLQSSINAGLRNLNSHFTYTDYLRTRTLVPEVLNILPASLQFSKIRITNEYNSIPDELIHKIRFSVINPQRASVQLFSILLPDYKLSNQQIVLSFEPETVQDQQIIDSYGGMDNTPAYLIHLRPVLKVNGERLIVGTDGIQMGDEYMLYLEIISPNGTEVISGTDIAGNLAVIGVVAQKAVLKEQQDPGAAKSAERLLYEETVQYADRWSKAEEELSSLLQIRMTRSTPSIEIVRGMINVSYLLDMPHAFTWKGVSLDAKLRAIDTTTRLQENRDRGKMFMALSSLQGSILENRIFEDDFQVEAISAAKLFQIVSAAGSQLTTIDKSNVTSVLPLLSVAENIKEDITDAVNQNFVIRIPETDVKYHDWSGTGYLKEHPETGEAGWMLSGMIAGSNTVDDTWLNDLYQQTLSSPHSSEVNHDLLAGVRIFKIPVTDKQPAQTVGTVLSAPLAVAVLDGKNQPVERASVTFKLLAGKGKIQCIDESGNLIDQPSETQCTAIASNLGVAKARLTLGLKTEDNPDYVKLNESDENYTQIGLNLVTATAVAHSGTLALDAPFEAYSKPGSPSKIEKVYPQSDVTVLVNNPAGSLKAKVTDDQGNPVSNVPLIFSAMTATSNDRVADPLPEVYRNVELYTAVTCSNPYPLAGDCPAQSSISLKTHYYGAQVETIVGNTLNTHYRVAAASTGLDPVIFDLYSDGTRDGVNAFIPDQLITWNLGIVNEKGEPVNATKAGTDLKAPLSAKMFLLQDEYYIQSEQCTRSDSSGNTTSFTGYSLVSKGTLTIRPISEGTVRFTALQGGGSAGQTRNLGNGFYQATYRTGTEPTKNIIEARGSASVSVPVIYADLRDNRYDPRIKCLESSSIPTTIVTLQQGQHALFDPSTNDLLQVFGTTENPTYTAYGVDTQLSIEPSIILLNDLGFTTIDSKLTYTILPPDYSALRADLDSYITDQSNNETWNGYVVADKTQGQGQVVFVTGTPFDSKQLYQEQVVLNRGTDMEVRGEKKVVPVAQVLVKDDNDAVVDELKFGRGDGLEKNYHIEVVSRAFIGDCSRLNGEIYILNQNGQPITLPTADRQTYSREYSLSFYRSLLPLGNIFCNGQILDTLDGRSTKDKFIISNLPRTTLDVGFPLTNVYNKAVLYGGIGNQAFITVNDIRKQMPIEPVGVIILGIDGLRQDVLYPDLLNAIQDPIGNYHVEVSSLSGMNQILAGDPEDDTTQRFVMLPNVTAIFPSITFASWASIFTGKLPNETGILGNEFFARDIYQLPFPQSVIPGLDSFPRGMVTLDADGGAFNPGGTLFALQHAIPVDFIPFANNVFWTLKLQQSAPANVLLAEPIWVGINTMVNNRYQTSRDPDAKCYQNNYECRTVSIFNQYANSKKAVGADVKKGADWWGTASINRQNAVSALLGGLDGFNTSKILDEISKNEAIDFINGYFSQQTLNGKRKKFPALFSVYLSGLDHYAHKEGMLVYRDFFMQTTDAQVRDIVDALKDKNEFDNKIFIITADHGHTAMPVFQPVTLPTDEIIMPDISCTLHTVHFDDVKVRAMEKENNNLHIWEFGDALKALQKKKSTLSYRVLAPDEIAKLFINAPAGARISLDARPDSQDPANIIAAFDGPMAHIYLRGQDWQSQPDAEELKKLAEVLRVLYQVEDSVEAENALGIDAVRYLNLLENNVGRLKQSVDKILIRIGGVYMQFEGYDRSYVIFPVSLGSEYIKAAERIIGLNHPQRSGDIILIMKDRISGDSVLRYTTGVACKSWHGSLNASDSYVPFIVAYPAGNKSELEPFINGTQGCSTTQGCVGNWKVTDLIKTIVQKQYGCQ